MNNKQWIKETIARIVTRPVPWNMSFSPPAIDAVQKHYGTENIFEYLDFKKEIKTIEKKVEKAIKELK